MNFVKMAQNHSFTKMRINIQHASNLCVIYQHYPCDMYINLHAIGLTGVTKIRYSYISFCAKSALISLVDFSVDIVASKAYFW